MSKKVLIAGASGFIGRSLVQELLKDESLSVVALSRQERPSTHPRLEWRKCDLFSLKEITMAMEGCSSAYYLVHSMLPTESLSQGKFYNFDLLLADNFTRALKKHRVHRLIYLGGLIPSNKESLSWHLKSRLEAEVTLKKSDTDFVMLRAGLIIGKNGSSFSILKNLVGRLPVMLFPSWTLTQMEPIDISDVVRILVRALHQPELGRKVYDIGGRECLSYRSLILKTAQIMGKKPITIPLNLIPLRLSRLWVSLITQSPRTLVYPLVLSLKHAMLVNPSRAWPFPEDIQTSIDASLTHALELSQHPAPTSPATDSIASVAQKNVRSVQRLSLPDGKNAEWASEEYFRWVPHFLSPFLAVQRTGKTLTFKLLGMVLLVLEKNEELTTPDRQLLYIRGGLLTRPAEKGRLEFRQVLDGTQLIAAIHEYRPALAWPIYKVTQAKIHLFVMWAFGRHLKSFGNAL